MRPSSLGLAIALLGVAACASRERPAGDSATAGDDGGAGAQGEAAAVPKGLRSFDVAATLTASEPSSSPAGMLASSVNFTIVLDTDAQRAVVGGMGAASTVTATSMDGRTFALAPFVVGVVTRDLCNPLLSVAFGALEIDASRSTFRAKVTGSEDVPVTDVNVPVPFTADVTGVAAATAPLLVPSSAYAMDSFTAVSFVSNEPLRLTAKAWMSTPDGVRIDLTPNMNDDNSLIVGFWGPTGVVPAADHFDVALDGLVDFAGRQGTATPLQISGFAAPPLVAADGFESATDAGGGVIVRSGGALPPISGAQSVYLGGSGAPSLPSGAAPPALTVRLAVPPGASKLRLSYRWVSGVDDRPSSSVSVGSVGHAAVDGALDPTVPGATAISLSGAPVTLSDVATKELALPADVTNEVVVKIESRAFACGGFSVPPLSGLLIDDLGIE